MDDAPRYPDGSIVMDDHATRENVARMASEIDRLRAQIAEVVFDDKARDRLREAMIDDFAAQSGVTLREKA